MLITENKTLLSDMVFTIYAEVILTLEIKSRSSINHIQTCVLLQVVLPQKWNYLFLRVKLQQPSAVLVQISAPPDRKHDYPPLFFRLTCGRVREGGRVVAQLLPLLASTVDPDTEAHEDDPAGPADARDERRLLDHVGDLLGQAHVAFLVAAAGSIAWHVQLFGWWLCGERTEMLKHRKRNDKNKCVLHLDKCQHDQGLM